MNQENEGTAWFRSIIEQDKEGGKTDRDSKIASSSQIASTMNPSLMESVLAIAEIPLKSIPSVAATSHKGTPTNPSEKADRITQIALDSPASKIMSSIDLDMGVDIPSFVVPPLHGDHTPAVLLQREHTHHRAICYLVSQGMNNVEVAEAIGVTPVTVAYTKKQPWAAELINSLMDQNGRKNVMKILSGAAIAAAKTLCEVAKMDGQLDARPSDRAKAANSILDRLYGTAPQVVMHGKIDPNELSDEELASYLKDSN